MGARPARGGDCHQAVGVTTPRVALDNRPQDLGEVLTIVVSQSDGLTRVLAGVMGSAARENSTRSGRATGREPGTQQDEEYLKLKIICALLPRGASRGPL